MQLEWRVLCSELSQLWPNCPNLLKQWKQLSDFRSLLLFDISIFCQLGDAHKYIYIYIYKYKIDINIVQCINLSPVDMMTLSNGNIFRVTGHLSPVNSPHIGQWRGTLMFFFDLRQDKQSWGWWVGMPPRSLWRHCNGLTYILCLSASCSTSYDVICGRVTTESGVQMSWHRNCNKLGSHMNKRLPLPLIFSRINELKVICSDHFPRLFTYLDNTIAYAYTHTRAYIRIA